MIVPNVFPTVPDPNGRLLAVVGEAPGADEELAGAPFVGASGRLLRMVLGHSGISADSCFIGNICQHRPPDNNITAFDWHGPEIQSGLAQLNEDLNKFKPNCVLVLGRTALRYFNPEICYPCKVTQDNPDGIKIPLGDWRGSPFVSSSGGWKCIPSYHPAYILRSFSDIAYLRADVGRAVRHSGSPSLTPTIRTGNLRPTLSDVVTFLSDLRATRRTAATDIEGYSDAVGITMLSIADSPTSGIVIPFKIEGESYWTEEEELIVWRELAAWLADENCGKILHNAFYETAVFGWRHQIVVNGIVGDTMMKHWEFYNELEKSLGVCTSLWIEEPYYKDDRTSNNTNIKLNYSFKDSACTKGIDEAIDPHLRKFPRAYEHYLFNVSLIPAYTYMHLRGCRFDAARAVAHQKKAEAELAGLTATIDSALGSSLDHSFNVKSTTDKNWLLYDHLGYEPYKRYGKTSKEEIILRYYAKHKNPLLQTLVRAINQRTRISDIGKLTAHADGRIRTSYDLVGTVTGRLSSRDSSITDAVTSPTGKTVYVNYGTNLQNVTKALRDCFICDSDDFTFFQADLSGADAWTVAADLAALGNDTMLQDLLAGVKPAKFLMRMLQATRNGEDVGKLCRVDSRTARQECDKVTIPEGILPDGRPADWEYTGLKKCSHGTNYMGKAETIGAVIFKDSDGVIDVPPLEIERWQRLYKLRYDIDLRVRWVTETLSKTGCIETAAGVRRKFYALRNPRQPDEDVVKAALASEPQTNTTFSTNLALQRLWNDPANRRKSGGLFIEPILQIHDALAGQFPTRLLDFARQTLPTYFQNELTIHGIKITIPVEIKIGRSWGDCKTNL